MLIDTFYPTSSLQEVKREKPKPKGVIMTVRGPFGMTEAENRNKRVYTNEVWEKVLGDQDIQTRLKERAIYGEADHPQTLFPAIGRVSHIVTDLKLDKATNTLEGEADILDTPSGRIIKTIYEAGGKIGISSRGAGDLEEKGGKSFVSSKSYKFGGFDFVIEPSMPNAYPSPARREELEESVSRILTESITLVEKEEDYYRSLLEKISPEGNVSLKRVDGSLVVVHKNQLVENSHAPSGTNHGGDNQKLDTNQSSVKSGDSIWKKKFESLNGAYDRLYKKFYEACKSKKSKKPEPEVQQETESAQILYTQEPTVEGVSKEEYAALARVNEELGSEISRLQKQVSSYEIALKENKSSQNLVTTCIRESIETDSRFVEMGVELKESVDRIQKQNSELSSLREVLETVQREKNSLETQLSECQGKYLESYVHLVSLEKNISEEKLQELLPEDYDEDDIDKVAETLLESRISSRQEDNDLPLFEERKGHRVVVTENQSQSYRETKSRVKSMIGKL